jgi:pimeloyl-ACP methyl ester carboxylesterase
LPNDVFGLFSKQGWVDSSWEQVDWCLEYPKPHFPSELRPPYNGPFPRVPMLMLNGDIDLQAPLESAKRATKDWPNSVFLTIEDAGHVSISTSKCAMRAALTFLEHPVLPNPQTCHGSHA